jgi:hypothetical protein
MYHATMTTISAEQNRDLRDQAAAWTLARQARRCAGQTRPASPFGLISRSARSLTRKRQQGAAAA